MFNRSLAPKRHQNLVIITSTSTFPADIVAASGLNFNISTNAAFKMICCLDLNFNEVCMHLLEILKD
jgi:hypothetical protein